MTQKSAARKSRDAAEAAQANSEEGMGSTIWDDLEVLYQSILGSLNNASYRLGEVYKTPGLKDFLQHRHELAISLRAVANDKDIFTAKLNEIRSGHAGRTGGSENGMLDPEAMNIFGNYQGLQSNIELILIPSVEHLIAAAGAAAEASRIAVARAAQEQTTTEAPQNGV